MLIFCRRNEIVICYKIFPQRLFDCFPKNNSIRYSIIYANALNVKYGVNISSKRIVNVKQK